VIPFQPSCRRTAYVPDSDPREFGLNSKKQAFSLTPFFCKFNFNCMLTIKFCFDVFSKIYHARFDLRLHPTTSCTLFLLHLYSVKIRSRMLAVASNNDAIHRELEEIVADLPPTTVLHGPASISQHVPTCRINCSNPDDLCRVKSFKYYQVPLLTFTIFSHSFLSLQLKS
jgi:hypothetical protein